MQDEVLKSVLDLCATAQGKSVCQGVGIVGFDPVKADVLDAAIKKCDGPRQPSSLVGGLRLRATLDVAQDAPDSAQCRRGAALGGLGQFALPAACPPMERAGT